MSTLAREAPPLFYMTACFEFAAPSETDVILDSMFSKRDASEGKSLRLFAVIIIAAEVLAVWDFEEG